MSRPSYPHSLKLCQSIKQNLANHALRPIEQGELRRAAVLILLMPNEQGESSVILTRRPKTIKRHSGQYALPGGRMEADETIVDAALRETLEEVGVDLPIGAILGRLDDFATRSGFCISAVVAWLDAGVVIKPDPAEVAKVHHIPLWDLASPAIPELSPGEDKDRPVMCAPLETLGHEVYAPTAALLYQFREIALFGRNTRVAHFEQPKFAWS